MAQIGFDFVIHRCALPPLIDTTKSLSLQESRLLMRGLKVVSLNKRQKTANLKDICTILGAEATFGPKGQVKVSIPSQKFKKLVLGPIIGLNQQNVIIPQQPALTLHLPPLHGDKQFERVNELRSNSITKQADKGGSIVIMKKEKYSAGMHEHVDSSNYTPVPDDVGNGMNDLLALFEEVNQKGPDECKSFIGKIDNNPTRQRHMYGSPKVHKGLDADKKYKLRPIIDCVGTPLSAADKAVAKFCSPLNRHMHTIASSSLEVVAAINEVDTAGQDVTLYTADVVDLYGNVPIQAGIDCLEKLLNEFDIGPKPVRNLVIRILTICLHNNIFFFEGKRYRQVHGIPMGSNSAPIVADAFLFDLERETVKNATGLILFKRYRDDLFGIFDNEGNARQFNNDYNLLYPTRIQLEAAFSNTTAAVLDIKLGKFEDGSIRTGVYFKPTNSLPLLHHDSNHPWPVLHGAIKGRFITFIRLCNNTMDLASAILSLTNSAIKYGYDERELLAIAEQAIVQCSRRQWPYTRPASAPSHDYRTINVVQYTRDLDRLYGISRSRKTRIALSQGPSLLKQLCRTKDG